MTRLIATCLSTLGVIGASTPAWSDPAICMASLTDVEILHRVRQDPYFRNEPLGKNVRIEYEYNGCGYRIHVGERSPASRDGDVLLVDREGRVIRVVHQR